MSTLDFILSKIEFSASTFAGGSSGFSVFSSTIVTAKVAVFSKYVTVIVDFPSTLLLNPDTLTKLDFIEISSFELSEYTAFIVPPVKSNSSLF